MPNDSRFKKLLLASQSGAPLPQFEQGKEGQELMPDPDALEVMAGYADAANQGLEFIDTVGGLAPGGGGGGALDFLEAAGPMALKKGSTLLKGLSAEKKALEAAKMAPRVMEGSNAAFKANMLDKGADVIQSREFGDIIMMPEKAQKQGFGNIVHRGFPKVKKALGR